MSKPLLSSTFLVLALSISALPASAAEFDVAGEAKSVTVTYGDLDTSNKLGAAVLLTRIESAAKTVCGPEPRAIEVSQTVDYNACVSMAISNAVSDANIPLVTELYAGGGATTTLAQK